MFQMQWRRMLQKKTVWFEFAIALGYAIYAFLYECKYPTWTDISGFWHYCGIGDMPEWSGFSTILTFLVAIPAMSFQDDVSCHAYTAVWLRGGREAYLKAKMKAVFWIQFLVTFIPFFLNLVLCLIHFQHTFTYTPSHYGPQYNLDMVLAGDAAAYGGAEPLAFLFKACPVAYLLLFQVFLSAFTGFLSLFLMGISFWFRRFKILLFLPVWILSNVGSMLTSWSVNRVLTGGGFERGEKFANFSMWDYVAPLSYYGKVHLGFFAFLFLLGLFIYKSYRMICRKEYTDV